MDNDGKATALMRVRGMDNEHAVALVTNALHEVFGVYEARLVDTERLSVDYDPSDVTVVDLIRAVRKLGFLAGIE